MIRCVRIWTGDDDNSLFEEGVINLDRGPHGDILTGKLPVTSVSFQETGSGGKLDWHTAPVRQLVVTLSGTVPTFAEKWTAQADSISRCGRAISCWPRIRSAAATAGN